MVGIGLPETVQINLADSPSDALTGTKGRTNCGASPLSSLAVASK